jgi:hypothetical protein
MILDDTHETAFIHIPKCGGTSISLQFRDLDSYGGAFRRKGVHPALGAIHYAHIPLSFLARCYPAEFGKVSAYRSFALARDPHERFASATFQRLEEFIGVPKPNITQARALDEARAVMRWLAGRGPFCDLEHIHFSRQIDYVALDGAPIVDQVYPIEDIAGLALALEARCQIRFDPQRRANTNFGSSNRLLSLLRLAKPLYSRVTTWELRERLLLMARRWKLQSPHTLYEAFREDAEISDFVEGYYAEDFRLYRAARNRAADGGAVGDRSAQGLVGQPQAKSGRRDAEQPGKTG